MFFILLATKRVPNASYFFTKTKLCMVCMDLKLMNTIDNENHTRPKRLGCSTNPDPRTLSLTDMPDLRALGLAPIQTQRFGLVVMPDPSDLGLVTMVWTCAWVLHQKTKKLSFTYTGIFVLPRKFFFVVIFYNNGGHLCLLRSGNNVRPKLHAWPRLSLVCLLDSSQ